MARRLSLALLTAVVVATPAAAATPILDRVVSSSRGGGPVYVHPGSRVLTAIEERRVEEQIEKLAGGPVLVSILPPAARREVDGTTFGLALELNRRIVTTNPPGVHAVLVDSELRAVNRDIDADRLAAEARRAHPGSVAAMLVDFARRVGEARAKAAAEATSYAPLDQPADNGNAAIWIAAAILAAASAAGAVVFVRRRHAR